MEGVLQPYGPLGQREGRVRSPRQRPARAGAAGGLLSLRLYPAPRGLRQPAPQPQTLWRQGAAGRDARRQHPRLVRLRGKNV